MKANKLINILQREKDRLFQYASYRLPNTADAEDALQDLYLAMMKKEREIGISDPKPYIYRALSNICTSKLRNMRYYETLEGVDVNDEAESFEEEFKIINSLLSWIPEEQAEVIRLHLHSEMTFVEVAEVLELPLATVKSRFRYGIGHIREELKRLKM